MIGMQSTCSSRGQQSLAKRSCGDGSVTESEKHRGREEEGRSDEKGRRYLSNDIIATEPVLVHDGDNYGGLPQHVGRHIKGEGLVENRVQTALHYHRLLLLHTLVLMHQPHLYVGV